MTKQDYIKYWIETANDDWGSVEDLMKTKHFLQALFFAHLSIEKICKAIWVRDNEENHPPRIHNLVRILSQTKVELPLETLDFLNYINDFQLQSRYPEYLTQIYKSLDLKKATEIFNEIKQSRQWLLNKMQ